MYALVLEKKPFPKLSLCRVLFTKLLWQDFGFFWPPNVSSASIRNLTYVIIITPWKYLVWLSPGNRVERTGNLLWILVTFNALHCFSLVIKVVHFQMLVWLLFVCFLFRLFTNFVTKISLTWNCHRTWFIIESWILVQSLKTPQTWLYQTMYTKLSLFSLMFIRK